MPRLKRHRRAALIAVLACGCGGAPARTRSACVIPGYRGAVDDGVRQFLDEVRSFRNYYALGDVSPAAHLYTVWYTDVEPTVVKLRVTEDATGVVRVEQAGGWWGGLGVRPRVAPPAPPAELARLTRAVEDAIAPCGGGGALIAYNGRHRVVRAYELISHGGGGWFATAQLHVDDALTRVEGVSEQMSAFGMIEVPRSARWVAFRPPAGVNGMRLLLAERSAELEAALLAAARDLTAGAPAPTLASLATADDVALVPAGFAQTVDARVTIYGRAANFNEQQGGRYRVRLSVRDAVFGGGATGETTITIGKRRFTLGATLTAAAPRTPTPARERADFTGTLAVRVDGGPRHRFERSFPATGRIEVEGDAVVARTGFELPGASSNHPAYGRLRASLPGDAQFTSFDVYVDVSVYGDPRR